MTQKEELFSDLFWHTRSPVYGLKGVVASSQPLASEIGMRTLQKGGNAADAAVAMAAALNVTQPCSTGIGGDVFALFYDAKSKSMKGINGSGRCPKALSIEKLRQLGVCGTNDISLPNFSPHTITVPGAPAAWCDVLSAWGSLSIANVLEPAIELAESGFPVSPKASAWWQNGVPQLKLSPNCNELLIDGRAPKPGEIMKNPNLAKTFRLVAEHGKDGFYKGPVADAIVAAVKEQGGLLSHEDLEAHKSTFDTPIHVNYKGIDVYEMPPNGQGLTALIALNILNGVDLSSLKPLSPLHTHYIIEALRLAFADTRALLGDPTHSKIDVETLLSAEYGKKRLQGILAEKATADIKQGVPINSSDTVYLSVVDRWGNACSFINSNYMGFGSGLIPKGFGFTLQNRGANFSLIESHPNCLAPGKRPYHTIIPGMALKDGELFASFGNMGGFMQPQGHVQLMVNMIDHHMDPQTALDVPRLCITDGTAGGSVGFEEGYSEATLQKLKEMGHNAHHALLTKFERSVFGNGQIITRDSKTGVLCGGSDLRSDGLAIAW